MATEGYFTKDPTAVLDYKFNWAAWLATGATISTSTWTVDDGITKDSDVKSATETVVWLSGGTLGESYRVTNKITTSGNRTESRTMHFTIKNR